MTPRILALAPAHDSEGKRDATGAFHPEAHRFLKFHCAEDKVRLFDNTAPKYHRRREVCDILEALPPDSLDVAAFFCHGFPFGIQTGHDKSTVGELAADLARVLKQDGKVVLYACLTAEDGVKATVDFTDPGVGGDGGFADALRDGLSRHGMDGGWVDGHVLAAHTTKNPYVRRFYMDGDDGDLGGDWLVAPRSPLWKRWRMALQGDMRLRFPLMTRSEIEAAL